LLDNHCRTINYLRLSVTDRCNLRCIYCMPEEDIQFFPHNEILTYEEMLCIVNLCIQKGIRKVRLTGGEPLVRKGIVGFIQRLCSLDGLEEITLTTNGVLLNELAAPLRKCGICRVNVSMDTLKPERFYRIARRDYFTQVWEGIEEAERVGLYPIKINVVAIRGINDDEIIDFARLTYRRAFHVRFIELMPIGGKNTRMSEQFIPIQEIFNQLRSLGPLRPLNSLPLVL